MFKWLKKTMDSKLKDTRRTTSQKSENINKNKDIINRNKIEILEAESIINKIKIHGGCSIADLNR